MGRCVLSLRAECNEAWQSRLGTICPLVLSFRTYVGNLWTMCIEDDIDRFCRAQMFRCAQRDNTNGLIYHNQILRFTQNDRVVGIIVPKEILTSACVLLRMTECNASQCHSEECVSTTWESPHTTGGIIVPNRDSHVGLRPPQNDKLQHLHPVTPRSALARRGSLHIRQRE